jgi:HNH endonuclease
MRGRGRWSEQFTDADYAARWKARCVITATGCWEWQGWRQPAKGTRHLPYASASYRGKIVRLHRKMLEIKLGRPLRPGMHACHACDNPPCINPDHVFEASNTDNQRDMVAKGRHCKQVTHCLRGHPLEGENIWHYTDKYGNVHRHCRECERTRWTRDKAKRSGLTVSESQP